MFGKKKERTTKISKISRLFKSKATRKTYKVHCYLSLNNNENKLVTVMTVAPSKAKAIAKVKREVQFIVEKAYLVKNKK